MAIVTGVTVRNLEVERGGFRLGPIDLAIEGGTAAILLGPSGAGKTTLLRAIAGFLGLREGSVEVDGVPVDREPPERRGFGFVPPSLGLFPHRRVARNVSYPLEIAGASDASAQARRWMERFDLVPLAHRYPHELSSGQQHHVAMARALAAHPRFLLWDEPLSALDVESRDVLLRLVRELIEREGLPLLLVTHDPTTALSLGSRLVVLDEGRVRFQGRPEELARGPLNRFTARFLGYENLYAPHELAAVSDLPLGAALARAAGPGGLVVPTEALRWSVERWVGDTSARVRSVRWSSAAWSIDLELGSLRLHVLGAHDAPSVRPGAVVGVGIDLGKVKPLESSSGPAG